MMERAIGLIETISIAAGIESADAMIKTAPVKLFLARPICPGKFLILVGGEVGAVKNSLKEGCRKAEEYLADSVLIPRVHDDIFPALEGAVSLDDLDSRNALGVIETFSVTACIFAADAAVKAAHVKLLEIRPAIGLGGKSYVTMLGNVSSIKTAVKAGCQTTENVGTLVKSTVIPNVAQDLLRTIL